jgi:ribosomal 50S subunit-associated protein YjgA (DUF615 family)
VKKCPTLTLTVRRTANGIYNLSIIQFIQSVGKMFQDLFHSDNAKVNATLDVLNHNSMKDNKIYDKFQAVGGRSALVHRMQSSLDKAIDEFPACDQVTE